MTSSPSSSISASTGSRVSLIKERVARVADADAQHNRPPDR